MRGGGPASGRGRGVAPLPRPRRPAGLRPAEPRPTCACERTSTCWRAWRRPGGPAPGGRVRPGWTQPV